MAIPLQASESAPTSTSQSGVSVEPQLKEKTSQESPQLEEILNWGRSLICQMLQISHVADVHHVDDLQFRKLWILKPNCTSNANCYQNWRFTVVKLQFDQRSCSARHSPDWNDASNPSPLSLVWETVMHFASLQENTNVPAHTVRHCILSHIPSVNLVIPHSLFPLIIAPLMFLYHHWNIVLHKFYSIQSRVWRQEWESKWCNFLGWNIYYFMGSIVFLDSSPRLLASLAIWQRWSPDKRKVHSCCHSFTKVFINPPQPMKVKVYLENCVKTTRNPFEHGWQKSKSGYIRFSHLAWENSYQHSLALMIQKHVTLGDAIVTQIEDFLWCPYLFFPVHFF